MVSQGATVDEIKSVLPAGTIPVPKTDFSMCVAEVKQELAKHSDIHQVCSNCSCQLGWGRTGSAWCFVAIVFRALPFHTTFCLRSL